jgi:hypothetical protein
VLNDRENILSALREKPLKVDEVMKRANVVNQEALPIPPVENARRRLGEVRYPQRAMAHRTIREIAAQRAQENVDVTDVNASCVSAGRIRSGSSVISAGRSGG